MLKYYFVIFFLSNILIALGQSNSSIYDYPKEYNIIDIDVIGINYLNKDAIISISGLEKGKKIKVPGADISKAIKNLWKQGILGDVKISVKKIEGDSIHLQISLQEQPRVSQFRFEGINRSQREDLEDKIGVLRGKIITSYLIKRIENVSYEYFKEKGFRNATIDISTKRDTVFANSSSLSISINKNNRVKINDILIKGNSVLKIAKIKSKLKKTKTKNFFRIFKASKFVESEYEEDKNQLIDYYNELGYRDARVMYDTIYSHDSKTVNIAIDIYEGKKYYYRDIYWTGNYKYDSRLLSSILGIKKGDVYNSDDLFRRLNFNPTSQDITSLYMDDGYLFFNISPIEIDVKDDSVDIEIRIYEGEQADINRVNVNGNTRTNDRVVYRELRTRPGDKFSRSSIIRTQRELSGLGYFDPENINISPEPNINEGTTDIVYDLEEKPSDELQLSGGWGGGIGFVGSVGIAFNNFSLRNLFNLPAWKPLPSGDGQRLALRVQANLSYRAYSMSFTEPWLGGKKPNSFSVNVSYVQSRLLSNVRDVIGERDILAVSLLLGKRLKFPDDYFTWTHSIGYAKHNFVNWLSFPDYPNGNSHIYTYSATISRNSIDNPIYPRTGSSLSLSMIFTPPYSLFDNPSNNGESFTIEQQYNFPEYHKYIFDNSWFTTIVHNLVLNARMHYGFLLQYNSSKNLGPFERFILGGDGLTQDVQVYSRDYIRLRGYSNQSILGSGGVSFVKYVMELRYPVSLNPLATIYFLGFLEAGNNWSTLREFSPFQVYRSLGVGARIFMPAFGMLGVDYAYGIDQIPGNPDANGTQFHFIIGQLLR